MKMKKVGFTSVIDKMGNKYGFIGIGKRIFAFDALNDTDLQFKKKTVMDFVGKIL
jgi:hypothetical protein